MGDSYSKNTMVLPSQGKNMAKCNKSKVVVANCSNNTLLFFSKVSMPSLAVLQFRLMVKSWPRGVRGRSGASFT